MTSMLCRVAFCRHVDPDATYTAVDARPHVQFVQGVCGGAGLRRRNRPVGPARRVPSNFADHGVKK